jgi:hypothetical protein
MTTQGPIVADLTLGQVEEGTVACAYGAPKKFCGNGGREGGLECQCRRLKTTCRVVGYFSVSFSFMQIGLVG